MRSYKKKEELLFKRIRDLSHSLAERYKLKKIYLFGSSVKGLFLKGSDIDLAIEGIDFEDYLKALAEYRYSKGMHFDLLDLDFCKPKLKEVILREGKVLYEKE